MPPMIGKYFLMFRMSRSTSSEAADAVAAAAAAPGRASPVAGAAPSIVLIDSVPVPSISADHSADRIPSGCLVSLAAFGSFRGVPAASGLRGSAHLDQVGLGLGATPPRVRAARLEFAAGRHSERVRNHALDDRERLTAFGDAGDGVEESLSVRMLRAQIGRASC